MLTFSVDLEIELASCEYGPFGEVIRATGPMAKVNPFTYQTEVYDWETDKIYWKNRYYDWSTGRFLARDPSEEPGSLLMTEDVIEQSADSDAENDGNLNRFVNNNPINETDALGLWPSSSPFLGILLVGHRIPLTHQNANASIMSGSDLQIVNNATVFVDTFQSTGDSYMHAMKGPGQDGGAAKALANAFVKQHLIAAESELCGCQADRNAALQDFGIALHTIQDSTSPAHNTPQNDFKVWDGESHWIKALRHVIHEDFDPGTGSALYRATAYAWTTYFKCIKGSDPHNRIFFICERCSRGDQDKPDAPSQQFVFPGKCHLYRILCL
jgi:RHS repeat-associated protein